MVGDPILVREEADATGRTLWLSRGRGNALETAGLAEIEAYFTESARAGAPAVLLASRGSSFCTGLDLDVAWGLDREGMRRLMEGFHRALAACFAYPGPVVAAVGGHALAGGALLALACDRRVMALGRARFGIHGVHLGISYPDVAIEIVRHHLPRREVENLLYRGAQHVDVEAERQGLVDHVAEADELIEFARRERDALVAHGARSFASHKMALRTAVTARLRSIDPDAMRLWLDQWFHPETRRRIAAARRRMRSRNSHPDHQAH